MLNSKNCLNLYDHLEKHLESGFSLTTALESAPGQESGQYRELIQNLYQGATAREGFLQCEDLLPDFDREILAAAAETSALPTALARLGEYHTARLKTRNALVTALLYPLVLVLLGVFLFPVLEMIDFEAGGLSGGAVVYAEKVLTYGLILWGFIGLLWVLFSTSSKAMFRLRNALPVVGKYQRLQALSHFCFGLSALLDAAVPVSRAWYRAGKLSGSPNLEADCRKVAEHVDQGQRASERLSSLRCFPSDFVAFFQTAEETGKIPETLQHQSIHFSHEAQRSLKLLWILLPILVILIVAGGIAYRVLQFYGQYFRNFESILGA